MIVLQPLDLTDALEQQWESVITQPLQARPLYEKRGESIRYTRIAQTMLGIFDDEHTMKEYLYNLQALPIGWTRLFEGLPKTIDAQTRTEIINILQIHKQTPLSLNRMLAFFVARQLLPLMQTDYKDQMMQAFKAWLELIDNKYPHLAHPNLQRIVLDFVKWSKHYFPLWLEETPYEVQMPKILWYGPMTESEAYFMYFLYLFGCDIVIFEPTGEDAMAKYGLHGIPVTKLAATCDLFEFPYEKPLQVQTVTARTYENIKQNFYESSKINYPWKYMEHETRAILLNTTYDEMFILSEAKLEHREGFDADEQYVYLPVLFGKIDGVSADMREYANQLKRLKANSLSYVEHTFPLIEPQRANMQFYVQDASINGELDAEKMIQMVNWPYKDLPIPNQRNIAKTLIRLIDMQIIQRLSHETEVDYKGFIMGQLFKIPTEILKLYRQFDYSYENPKYILFIEEDTKMQRSDALFLVFLAFLGFDVFIFSPGGGNNIELFLSEPIVMTHRLEKIEFHLKLDEVLVETTQSTKNKRMSLKNIFDRIKRRDF
ncbi:YceG family protein [Lysinibacillus sp. LZ02]|uniref:YceG family protein n=1 Tax=Lysinibacillus sp. LZ02 TaxID=3420668 RepID=UPI003D369EEA